MKIAITVPDGGVSIMSLAEGADVAAEIAKWEASGFTAVSWRGIVDDDLPPTREFRDAWYDTGTEIAIDPTKAAAIARKPTLAALPSVTAMRTLFDTADGPGIDAWAIANANTLPELRQAFRTLLKLLAARL